MVPRGKQGGRAAGGGDPFGGGCCFGRREGARLGLVGRLPASPAPSIACPRFSAPLVHSPLCSTTRPRFAVTCGHRAGIRRALFGNAVEPHGNGKRQRRPLLGSGSCSNPLGGDASPLFSAPESGFRDLSVIRGYRTVTCCEIEACAILSASRFAARLYAPATC